MAIGIETGRLMYQKAAWLVDQGQPHGFESAIAKAYCSEMAFSAANEGIQIHGGYGYVAEYPVEKLLRDVKLNMIYEGTNEIQRVVISRNLLKYTAGGAGADSPTACPPLRHLLCAVASAPLP